MKTVLSIDFDIIMAPTIELYNNLVPKQRWESMENENPLCALAYPDLTHYQNLVNYIISLLPKLNKDNIFIIENHGKIIDYITKDDEPMRVINIDHHHDVWYPNGQYDKITCANWVQKLDELKQIKEYIWIKNKNSIFPVSKEHENIITEHYNLQDLFMEGTLNDIVGVPDILVLCLSEPWIPVRYRPLFFLILDILNNYYNTHFPIRYGESESDFKCKLKS